MKIYISKYRDHWISPYTILDYIFFWTDWSKCSRDKSIRTTLEQERNYVEPPKWVDRWADRLEPISRAIQWIGERIYPRIEYVKIDRWDTWSMDHTLAMIILPTLKQLHATKHGAPIVDDEDVPDEIKSTNSPPRKNEWDTDDNHFKRWDYVLDEMIFAFEHLIDDSWQEQFRSGVIDWKNTPCEWDENGKPTRYKMEDGPNHTYKCDYDSIQKIEERMQNGFKLFGKYYRGLWD
jgi:hypothetical protein